MTARTLYDLLGVRADCSAEELRAAYRRQARLHHPDVAEVREARPGGVAAPTMAEVNEAWRVLSDPARRADYDRTIVTRVRRRIVEPTPSRPRPPGTPPPSRARTNGSTGPARTRAHRTGDRRAAWVAGVQAQIVRLSRLAGRSATQTLLLRGPRAERRVYEELVDAIVLELARDTEARLRAARAAGAAPLDLGVAATLVGIRSLADTVRRTSSLGLTAEVLMTAELLDRMWDVLAHELPLTLTDALGGNPRLGRRLAG